MEKVKNILKGFIRELKGKIDLLPEELMELSSKRMAICKECPLMNKSTNVCKNCGCYLPAKTKLEGESCPKGHWKSIYGL